VRALDAFCPHMGADLGNGRVVGDTLECYFHQWRLGVDGRVCPKGGGPTDAGVAAWPGEERYGWIWVYAAPVAPYPVPSPPGLEGEAVAVHLASVTLYAHHHVMMVGGIDLAHFRTVHGMDVRFEVAVDEAAEGRIADWALAGTIPPGGWRSRLGEWLVGPSVGYRARFAGGTVVTLTYGREQRWLGRYGRVPPLHILWGCVPTDAGVSRVEVFLLAPRGHGLVGALAARARIALTALLLAVLRDDDVKAFPHMRFTLGRLTAEDAAVARLARFLDQQPISAWSAPTRPGAP